MNATGNTNETSDSFTYYLTSNVMELCRICLEKSPKLIPIFDQLKPAHFSTMLMSCVSSIQVIKDDNLPQNICSKCISKLNIAFQFKTECEIADNKFRQALQTLQNQNKSLQTDRNTVDQQALLYEEELFDKSTKFDGFECNNATKLDKNSKCDKNITLTIIDQEKYPQVNEESLKEVSMNLQSSSSIIHYECYNSSSKDSKKKRVVKEHRCYVCDKVFKTGASMVHHIRIHTGERPYVCHLCDKRFVNSGHLHTHLRTHTGEKNHMCSTCTKAFATAQQLTKHTIAVHTSERPYGCQYCGKRFANSSNLSTHIRIHTGEKNFYCDQCGKAFSTKAQLYQHMLVHTGEKAFLCELCQKRFSQKAHLVRHLKMHQKTADK